MLILLRGRHRICRPDVDAVAFGPDPYARARTPVERCPRCHSVDIAWTKPDFMDHIFNWLRFLVDQTIATLAPPQPSTPPAPGMSAAEHRALNSGAVVARRLHSVQHAGVPDVSYWRCQRCGHKGRIFAE